MNHLTNETSPYLRQHAGNPVDWYPWGQEAFVKAKRENKPVFLSVGYSTCHWCHVMAHEVFEDKQAADILNKHFISIKVDREERPDINSIYMQVCQALTGNGGWPTTIFMTPDQIPFYAGTYFPKPDFCRLTTKIAELWQTQPEALTESGIEIINALTQNFSKIDVPYGDLPEKGFLQFENAFDETYGGFGTAPKFPSPHNLLFLMEYYEKENNEKALLMAEKTLTQMYRGGLFDHIGFGFSRYSTDRYFFVPHFEKMLCDNGLLMLAYIHAYEITQNSLFKDVAVKTASYILREMTDPEGGFYTAQDADSEGEEGKYYLFNSDELVRLLGKENASRFNRYYGITEEGNFEGKNIPNLLGSTMQQNELHRFIPAVLQYRKDRMKLHLDDKILTSWNSIMICAFARMYLVLGDQVYLETAKDANRFIENKLLQGDTLYVSYREKRSRQKGFLDDYAYYILAQISLYEATFEQEYLDRALIFTQRVMDNFLDSGTGGFYLYGRDAEQLVLRPKETYDGAIPSGNSVMAYNLVKLWQITQDEKLKTKAEKQLDFMISEAAEYPMGHSFFLLALSKYLNPPLRIVCVRKSKEDYIGKFPLDANVKMITGEDEEYRLLDGKTTYYVCGDSGCLPPTNHLEEIL